MVDIDKVLKNTVKKGKVMIGNKQTMKVMKEGSAKLIVLANNCLFSNDINKIAKNKKIRKKTANNN